MIGSLFHTFTPSQVVFLRLVLSFRAGESIQFIIEHVAEVGGDSIGKMPNQASLCGRK